jgi:hypothetical protein
MEESGLNLSCPKCEFIAKNKHGLYVHCGIKHPELSVEDVYCTLNKITKRPVCPYCGNPVGFDNTRHEFHKTCKSGICIKESITDTFYKNTGKNFYEHIKEATKETNLKKYGFPSTFQVAEFREKGKQTNLKNLGVENAFQSPLIQVKIKLTNIERYGNEYPLRNSDIRAKRAQTQLSNSGYSHSFENPEIINKAKKSHSVQAAKRRRNHKDGLTYKEFCHLVTQFTIQSVKYYNNLIIVNSPLKSQERITDLFDDRPFSQRYDLDHIISKISGYRRNIPPEIIGSVFNLQYISFEENRSKGMKNGLSLPGLKKRKEMIKTMYPSLFSNTDEWGYPDC